MLQEPISLSEAVSAELLAGYAITPEEREFPFILDCLITNLIIYI